MAKAKSRKIFAFGIHMKNKRATSKRLRALRKTTCKLRSNISPGTVLILLSGGFRGKRVVFLKQLEPSGLLLVSGPFKVNGVPLRRVNQRYVIATSTKVEISGVDTSGIKDEMFTRTVKQKVLDRKDRYSKGTEAFVDTKKGAQQLPDSKKQLQDKIDVSILSVLKKDQLLTQYLKTKFSLRANQAPHAMKF